jgi:hypothetical protein
LNGSIARMTLLWLITGASLVVAFVAWSQARRAQKRLDQLSQMYWELKYQQGELRAQLQRAGGATPLATPPSPAPPTPAGNTFIPLTSLKR